MSLSHDMTESYELGRNILLSTLKVTLIIFLRHLYKFTFKINSLLKIFGRKLIVFSLLVRGTAQLRSEIEHQLERLLIYGIIFSEAAHFFQS
jgi:hypothetical protein